MREESVMVQSLTEPLPEVAAGGPEGRSLGARSRGMEPSKRPSRERVLRGATETGSTGRAFETCTTQTVADTISRPSWRTARTRGRPTPARQRTKPPISRVMRSRPKSCLSTGGKTRAARRPNRSSGRSKMSLCDATRRAWYRSYGEFARWLSLKPSRLRTLLFDCRTDLAQQGVRSDSPVLIERRSTK